MDNLAPKRSLIPSVLALARKQFESAVSGIASKETFKVEDDSSKEIVKGINDLNQAIKSLPKIEMKDSPASISIQTMSEETISALTKQLSEVRKAVEQSRTSFPAMQEVSGTVRIENPVSFPIDSILKGLKDLESTVRDLKLVIPPTQPIKFPEFPKEVSLSEAKAILVALADVKNSLEKLPKSFPEINIPTAVEVKNFPPQKYPLPVTNININALRGYASTAAVTVGTTAVALPTTPLAYRRSLVVYNNSASTLYVGGSNVTTVNGMPVPANSYSPAFDAGPKMIVYGVVASSTADVRVLELSNDNVGG